MCSLGEPAITRGVFVRSPNSTVKISLSSSVSASAARAITPTILPFLIIISGVVNVISQSGESLNSQNL